MSVYPPFFGEFVTENTRSVSVFICKIVNTSVHRTQELKFVTGKISVRMFTLCKIVNTSVYGMILIVKNNICICPVIMLYSRLKIALVGTLSLLCLSLRRKGY